VKPEDAYLIGTDDGKLFRCYVESVGPRRERSWCFTRKAKFYVGPDASAATSLDEVEEMFEKWWAIKKALGHARDD
jgi:hypothetical protein